VLRGLQRFCFVVGLGILLGGWTLTLVATTRRDGRPPGIWLEEGREIERARAQRDFAAASEQTRIRGVLRAQPVLLRDAANLALQAEDPELGIAALTRLVALEPRNANARFQLAAALMQEGRRRDAADQLRALLERNPKHQRARQTLDRIEKRLEAPF